MAPSRQPVPLSPFLKVPYQVIRGSNEWRSFLLGVTSPHDPSLFLSFLTFFFLFLLTSFLSPSQFSRLTVLSPSSATSASSIFAMILTARRKLAVYVQVAILILICVYLLVRYDQIPTPRLSEPLQLPRPQGPRPPRYMYIYLYTHIKNRRPFCA